MLTDVQIEKLAIPASRREIAVGKVAGLYLVVQPTGAKSFALRYRVAGKPTKLTLGAYPALTLKAARQKAQKAIGEVAGGNDPSAQKKVARETLKAANSTEDRIETVVDSYAKKHLAKKCGPRWAKEAERLLRVEIVPKWGKKRLAEIKDTEVHARVGEIADRAPITANRTFFAFSALCNWAMTIQGGRLLKVSPCIGVKAPSEEHVRDRVLDDREIALAWRAFDAIGWPFGPIAKLLLMTGARRSEISEARWSEIDLAAKTLTLSGSRTKNGKTHVIPLCDAALDLIQTLPRIENKAGLVFTRSGAAVSGFARVKAAIDGHILKTLKAEARARGKDPDDVAALPPWTMHDIRRTTATGLQKLGVKLEVTEAILNHVSGSRRGIVGVYQRHEYADEKRAALGAWARRLEAIVGGAVASNVVEFVRG